MWTWKEGLREAISTFRTAADLLDEFPEFVFNHNESLLYEWVEEYDPTLFKRIQKLVSEKRWFIAGGLFLQPDLNVSGGEILIRHILLGRNYFYEKFGARPRVAYNFDTFGHPAGFPQLLKQAGYELYIHCRPMQHQLDLPAPLYRWRGCDGSEIVAIRPLTGFYNANAPGQAQEKAVLGLKLARELDREILVLWGLGDHGGGATREDLYSFRELIKKHVGSDYEIRHSTPEGFLKGIRPNIDTLPVYSGALQRTHSGTYTSVAPIKRAIRECEALMASAESESTIAWWRNQADYPAEKLRQSWKDLLFNTFHDTASGTILEEAVPEVMDIFGSVRDSARKMIIKAQHHLLPAVSNTPGSIPIYVFNPHPYALCAPVGINVLREHNSTPERKPLVLYDDCDRIVAHQEQGGPQILLTTTWQPYIGFIADVPAMSFRRYEVRNEKNNKANQNLITVRENDDGIHLETPFWQVEFHRKNAALIKLILRDPGKNLLSEPVQLFAMDDSTDAWGGECKYRYNDPVNSFSALSPMQVGEFSGLEGTPGPALRVLHSGPVFTTVECLVGWQYTRASIQYTFYTDLPYIDVNVRLYMAARSKMIKLVCPFDVPQVKVTCETAYGVSQPDPDGTEYPYGRWIRLGNDNVSIGLANSGQSGFDVNHKGTLGLSLSRGAVHIAWEGGPALETTKSYTWMDQGQIDTGFRILAGVDSDKTSSELISAALLLNQPFERFFAFYPPTFSENAQTFPKPFLQIEPKTVILGALKRAENEEAIVIRLMETVGKKTRAKVDLEDSTQYFDLDPYQVRSFIVHRVDGKFHWQEIDLMELKKKAVLK
jgi:alpha-mannosidase